MNKICLREKQKVPLNVNQHHRQTVKYAKNWNFAGTEGYVTLLKAISHK